MKAIPKPAPTCLEVFSGAGGLAIATLRENPARLAKRAAWEVIEGDIRQFRAAPYADV
jgi:hypothetical protein